MAILTGDVKLVASHTMDDVTSGGGAPTAVVIADGASNSVFNDISELDRAGGRVSLRKLFASVQTPSTETYLGGNIIVADPPDDPNVSVTIFSTGDVFDHRTDARDRIEAYMNKVGTIDGFLFENHIEGQRAIQIFQRPTAGMIAIGATLYLVQNEGLASEFSQYVRVTKVTQQARKFTEVSASGGVLDYDALVTTCELSDALRHDFRGSPASRSYAASTTVSVAAIRDTLVADAARYYGAVSTTSGIGLGDISADVSSIYTKLVPSAQTETPLVNLIAGGSVQPVIDASNGVVAISYTHDFFANSDFYLGGVLVPGSLAITFAGSTITDNGGDLLLGATVIGSVDYAAGTLKFSPTCPTLVGNKTVTYKAGAAPVRVSDTAQIAVTATTRAYNYSLTIDPPPAPGTLSVSYRAQGNWYELRDKDSNGKLKGADTAIGVGTISYSTGTASVTLGVLPDAGSTIVYSWGSDATYFNRSAETPKPAATRFTLTHTGVIPNTFSVSWAAGGAKTASDNGTGGITGDATGKINYATGEVELRPTLLPAGGAVFTTAYSHGALDSESISAPAVGAGNTITIALAKTALHPGTVRLAVKFNPTVVAGMPNLAAAPFYKYLSDNGSGVLKDAAGTNFGTVNYTTGVVAFPAITTVVAPYSTFQLDHVGSLNTISSNGNNLYATPDYRNVFAGWGYQTVPATLDSGTPVSVQYSASGTAGTINEDFTGSQATIDLTQNYAEPIVPGSVHFTLGGEMYFDRIGSLYYNLNPATGSATLAGSINYETGEVSVSAWAPGLPNSVSVKSLLTSLDEAPVDSIVFRVPTAPLRSGSVQVLATKFAGGTVNITADANGKFQNADAFGLVDYETGVVSLRFGTWVTAAGKEAESYYSAGAVVGGMIFKPAYVYANTVRYNAVAYSYLPLDADLIGLDPVRLPQDGRVPIFRKGDFAVIGHTATVAAQNVANNQTVNCGRVRLSRVRVIGSDSQVINTGYSADLEAGTVAFTNVSGYAQPVRVEHRIEDMVQVSDVQISGKLSFTRQVTHNYPVGSVVSSALLAGDLHAYVPVLFDQATWDGSYVDTVSGAAATGTFNDTLAPIAVSNAGAVTERWTLQFTNATNFRIIGEHVGVIGIGTIASDTAPNNPATGAPYFTVPAAGWGSGWAAGNALRFNTVGALYPFWVVRTVQQGLETVTSDSFTVLVRGDVDRT